MQTNLMSLQPSWRHKWCLQCITSVTVVQIGELVPFVVLNKAEEGSLDIRSHLDDKLLIPVQRETGRDERDVERAAK